MKTLTIVRFSWLLLVTLLAAPSVARAQSGAEPFTGPPSRSLGSTVSGSIDAGNLRDDYTFTASPGTVVFLDRTAASSAGSLNWKLCDSFGRVLTNHYTSMNDLGPVTLLGGDYTITILSESGGESTYEFLISDATPEQFGLTIGTPVVGNLDNPGGTHDYVFTAVAGQKVYLDVLSVSSLGSVRWDLIDPAGRVLAEGITSLTDSGPFKLGAGDHTLRIRSDNSGTSEYEVVLQDVSDLNDTVAIGDTVIGEITGPGQVHHYEFTAATGQKIGLVLGASSATNSLNYRIVDTYGREVLARTTSINNPPSMTLMGGDYTLSILPEGGTTATYEFTLEERVDLTAPLVIGSPIVGELATPQEIDSYSFTANPGDRLYLDYNGSASNQLDYVITSAAGTEILRTPSLADVGPITLGGGDHTVSIVGEGNNLGVYDFTPYLVTDLVIPTTVGATEASSIAVPGQALHYTFNAAAGQVIGIDAITPASLSSINWSLTDALGRELESVPSFLDRSGIALVGGDYTLTITPENGILTPIEFTILDEGFSSFVPTGSAISLDIPVVGELSTLGETDEYTLVIGGTERVYFDLTSVGGGFNWGVFDEAGQPVFGTFSTSSTTSGDRGPYDLSAGTYQVLVSQTGSGLPAYEFTVIDVVDFSAGLTVGGPSSSGSILTPGGTAIYDLSLPSDARVYFDLLSGAASLDWSLRDEFGNTLFPFAQTSSTTSADRGPYDLGAGNYQLIWDADNHQLPTYEFAVTSVTDQVASAAVGDTISGTFASIGGSHSYDLVVAEGEQIYFDVQAGSSQIRMSCYDPVGQSLFSSVNISSTTSGDRGPYQLQAGTYRLLLDPLTHNLPSYTVQIQSGPITELVWPLGTTVAGSFLNSAETQQFNLTLGTSGSYYFDLVLGASQLWGRLEDEHGNTVFDQQLFAATLGDRDLDLVAGEYKLFLDVRNGTSPSFEFVMSENIALTDSFTVGDPFDVTVPSAGGHVDYEFLATSGQQLRFEVLAGITDLEWSLYDEVGESAGFWQNLHANTTTSRGPLTLGAGLYTLRVSSRNGAVPTGTFLVEDGMQPDPIAVEAGWELTDSIRFPFAQSARRRASDGALFVGSNGGNATGIYCVHETGIPTYVDNSGAVSGVGITDDGEVFWSEDSLGRILSVTTGQPWVNGFGAGDADPAGMSFTPADYVGPLPIAGLGLITDPGLDGEDGLWIFSPDTTEGEIALVGDSSLLEQAVDVAISSTEVFVADAGDGEFGTIWRVEPGEVLVDIGATGLVPVGIAIDPVDGNLLVVDRIGERLVRVNPTTGTATDVVVGLDLQQDRAWSSIDISADGRKILLTSSHVVHEFTRCGVSGVDCNGNGVDDDCDISLNTSQDCNGNGVPDECDIDSGVSIDLNFDGIPDECLPCSKVDLVFLVDTSGSMTGEGAALCELMPDVIEALLDAGIAVDAEIFGIGATPGNPFNCLTGNARELLGGGIGADCSSSAGEQEDWGRATAAVAEFFPWTPGAVRVIVPVADEGPYCGDGLFADDQLSVDAAVEAAVAAGVIVSPITGDGSSAGVLELAQELADGTGGQLFETETSTVEEITLAVQGLVISSCPCGVALTELSPASGTELPVGTTITVSGRATAIDPERPVAAVLINGLPVDSLDASGRFFLAYTVIEGDQTLAIEIVQSCDVSDASLELTGTPADEIDTVVYSDVSNLMVASYSGTTYNHASSTLQVVVEACNNGGSSVRGPIRMVIDGFTQPLVSSANPDGQLDDGRFFFEFLPDGGTLAGGECSEARTLVFDTPGPVPVLFDVVWLAADNRAPVFQSSPAIVAEADVLYTTTVVAIDLDGDAITYGSTIAPNGFIVDTATGLATWTPTVDDIGVHEVRITATDTFGAVTTQQFLLTVEATIPNHAPYFSSAPVTQVAVGAVYSALATAVDIDGDLLTFSKIDGPIDLVVAATGEISWPFTLPGTYPIHLRVTDGQGGQADQQYTLTVGAISANPSAPQIFGSPAPVAVANQLYLYQPAANDADPADLVSFSLAVSPPGMQIDGLTGRVTWIPLGTDVGNHPVTLVADDNNGAISSQSWSLEVLGALANRAPVVQSVPTFYAETGLPYFYEVQAFDPDFDVVTFELVNPPIDMTIDPDTGLIEWTPSVVETVLVAIKATDPSGAFGSQVYELGVIPPNTAPTIDSSPETEATVAGYYGYGVDASDVDGHTLGYILDVAPVGMMVAASGQISWTPGPDQVGMHDVTVRVTDGFGGEATQSYQITVIEDVIDPVVAIEFSHNPAPLGQPVLVTIGAADAGLIVEKTLTIDGVEQTLDAFGAMIFDTPDAGDFELVATATDFAGNVGTAMITLSILAPDAELPVVELVSPQPESMVNSLTDIVVSISDNNPTDLTWTVGYRPDETSDLTIFAKGAGEVTDSIVAALDPTVLRNGSYWIQVLAQDQTGNTGGIEFKVQVSSDLKLGQFKTSFLDLTIPLAGIPITISRQYSSLDADVIGDFGYGWRLGLAGDVMDSAAEIDHPIQLVDDFNDQGFGNNTRVYVTLPNGERVGFTFDPQPGAKPWLRTASYKPDVGVTATLEALPRFGSTQLFFLGGFYAEFVFPYNPEVYIITTQEGVKYTIHEREGLQQIEDIFGNTIDVTPKGLFSSLGVAVLTERDKFGRITRVVEPEATPGVEPGDLHYAYDPVTGNLSSFTDQEDNVTLFSYDQPEVPHHLTDIEDPLGRPIVANVYDDMGRAIATCNDVGNVLTLDGCLTFEYDNVALTQTTFDSNGNQSVYFFDEVGHLLVERRYTSPTEFVELTRTYDDNGNMTSELDPEGYLYTFEFDDRNNMTSMTNPGGDIWTFTYDERDNLTQSCDPSGNCRVTVYDEEDRVIQRTDPLGNTDFYTYYDSGQLASHLDPEGNLREYGYSSKGYLVQQLEPNGAFIEYGRDGLGRLTSLNDANGRISTYVYSETHKLLEETWDTTPVQVMTYTWNAVGHLTSATNSDSSLTLDYWPTGHLRTVTSAAAGRLAEWTVSYSRDTIRGLETGYDFNGNLTHVLDSFGGVTEYGYDPLDRVSSIIQYAGDATVLGGVAAPIAERALQFEYDDGSLLLATRRFNDAAATNPAIDTLYGYDCGACPLRITSIDHRRVSDDVSLHALSFVRDGRGGILEWTDAEGLHVVAKDGKERLLGVTHPGAPGQVDEFYSYDTIGNRVTSHLSSAYTIDYMVNPGEGSTLLSDDSYAYTYDPAGNLIERVHLADSTSTTYTYDHRNRLTEVRHFDASMVELWAETYQYDAINRRIRVDENGVPRQYVHDRHNVLLVLDGGGSLVERRLVGHQVDEVFGYEEGGNAYWYLHDHKHTVRDIVDTTGTVQRHYVYDTFGNVVG
ncbi:MAG: putative Ig domain-containing protein, partial [Planctomycetota bacterium]